MDKQTLSQCAAACRESSQMFAHGTIEFNEKERCEEDKCDCVCLYGTENYKCKSQTTNLGFNLYTFIGKCSFIPCRKKC